MAIIKACWKQVLYTFLLEYNKNRVTFYLQTRALSPQYAESDAIRFLIGTQSLKPNSNQVHVVELEEDTGALHTMVWN